MINKENIKKFIPPVVLSIYHKYKNKNFGWSGNYNSWDQAKQDCTGYDSEAILSKCENSLLKVKAGLAVYERDSVLFDKIEYSWPVLTALLKSAQKNNGSLHVLDFGGSIGSSYFQNKLFLNDIQDFSWSIVEQKHFVESGLRNFKDSHLNFYESIERCFSEKKPTVLLLSSVLQYLENPTEMIKYFLGFNFEYIIIDLTGIFDLETRLTIQKVPPQIYEASYPCWIFNEKELLTPFLKKYLLVADFESYINKKIIFEECSFQYKGYIFKRIDQ